MIAPSSVATAAVSSVCYTSTRHELSTTVSHSSGTPVDQKRDYPGGDSGQGTGGSEDCYFEGQITANLLARLAKGGYAM